MILLAHNLFHSLGVGRKPVVQALIIQQSVLILLDLGCQALDLFFMLLYPHDRVVIEEKDKSDNSHGKQQRGRQIALTPGYG